MVLTEKRKTATRPPLLLTLSPLPSPVKGERKEEEVVSPLSLSLKGEGREVPIKETKDCPSSLPKVKAKEATR